jgi:alkylation response protein AidB-like acyl-CoA dehydrogenase
MTGTQPAPADTAAAAAADAAAPAGANAAAADAAAKNAEAGQLDHQGEGPLSWRRTADAFAAAIQSGRLDLPLPGHGHTFERWAALSALAEEDLSLARLGEGHADAVAILAELGGPLPLAGSRWGVWAANPPGPGLAAERTRGGCWRVRGTKRYCSGARICTHALVTAAAADGNRLFAVATEALTPLPGTWPATGMAGSDTLDVGFDDISAELVGPPGGYIGRAGFSHGGIGVAACWYGGARAAGRMLLTSARQRDTGPHALAHLGAVDIALRAARSALRQAAAEIDADPSDGNEGQVRALRVRALVEAVATEVMDRVGRALGAGPLCHDEAHSRRIADLTVYLRQHHAERDLAELGALTADRGTTW